MIPFCISALQATWNADCTNTGTGWWTVLPKKYNVHKLVYFEHTGDVYSAISREKQLKKWSRQKKNELIKRMNPDWVDLTKNWQ